MNISCLCKEKDFYTYWYNRWVKEFLANREMKRKQWEYCYITQSIFERGLMTEGNRGLGFAVGTEPMSAIFAKYGVNVTGTDLDIDAGKTIGWEVQNQLCLGINSLNKWGICPDEQFKKYATYRPVDMNNIPDNLIDFDFNWSSCAFEHIGGIEKGLAFLRNQLKTLKRGGWAVHTSEFNLSSDTDTLDTECLSIFRKQDYEKITKELRDAGHFVEELDFSYGDLLLDHYVDFPPYHSEPHLRLLLDKYIVSSFGLIIQKR